MSTILESVLKAVGNTPLVRLDRIAKREGLKCNLLGKLEYMSPGGSVKDRVAKRLVEIAERDGKLIPGKSVVIEPTSGNTGIGLAMVCAIKGYPVIITMPKKMSLEKEATLRALGAEVVRTPNEAAWESPESHGGVALRLETEIPGGIILDQFRNMNNPLAHELTTAPEIIEAVTAIPPTPVHPSSGKVDMFVAGAGTGGTISGVAKGIKKAHNSHCIIVGVDPIGSVLALPPALNEIGKDIPFVVEGIGHEYPPDVLTRKPDMINEWVKTSDSDAFAAVRLLMRHEGALVGGSSGSALAGALAWLRSEKGREIAQTPGKNVVVLLPDGLRNYISKDWFLDISLRQEPSALGKRISELLARPAAREGKDKTTTARPCKKDY